MAGFHHATTLVVFVLALFFDPAQAFLYPGMLGRTPATSKSARTAAVRSEVVGGGAAKLARSTAREREPQPST